MLAMLLQEPASIQMSGHTREVSSAAISSNGKFLASGSVDQTIRIWDSSSHQGLAILEGHDGEIPALAFSPDGKYLASGDIYKKVKVWDTTNWKEKQMYTDMEGGVMGLAFSADGKRIFAACKDNTVRFWDVGSSAASKTLPHKWAVNGIAVSPDGKTLATIEDGGNACVWDATALKLVKVLPHGVAGRSVAFSHDGAKIVTTGGGKIKVWETATGASKAETSVEANAAVFTPNGKNVIVGTQDNLVMCLDASDLSVKWKSEKHERPVTSVTIAPDGKTAFTSSMDYTIRAWPLPQ